MSSFVHPCSSLSLVLMLLALCVPSRLLSAQYLSDDALNGSLVSDDRKPLINNSSSQQKSSSKRDNISNKSSQKLRKNYLSREKKLIGNPQARSTSDVPQVLSPTQDGSQRGVISFGQIVRQNNGRLATADTASIFLYYDNFSIRKGLFGDITCDVRFYVMTTLDRKLSTLSVKLKWPKMETALNFVDVLPNVETYFDYTLVGEGCYSMDKVPNIIVNRCRVTKMSQEECSAKIKWLKKGL